MRATFRTLMLIVSLIASANTQSGQSAATGAPAPEFSREFSSAPGKTLNVDLRSGGDVKITGAEGNAVKVRMSREGRNADEIELEARESSSGVDVTSTYEGDGRHSSGSVHVEVEVPSRYNVKLQTMGGDVSIHGVEGDFSGQTMGGDLDLKGLKGEADLRTMGGEIQVADSDLAGEVETMGGDVTFRNVAGSLHGSTMGGDFRQEGSPSTRKGSSSAGAEKKIHSMGGDLDVDTAPEGANLETMGGDIHVGTASDHVRAKTMGGEIQVDSIDGSADLTTMGGDVTVHMTGDPAKGNRNVSITSMGGDIQLTVPEGLAASFDLETEYSEVRGREPRIVSDFPVTVSRDTCEHDHGESCVSLRATGKSGDGRNLVKIRTIQGDIIIRKG